MKHHQGIVWTPLLIIVATLIGVSAVTYMIIQTNNTSTSEKNTNTNSATDGNTVINTNQSRNTDGATNTSNIVNTNSSAISDDWQTYVNTEYGFQLQYPSSGDWRVENPGVCASPCRSYFISDWNLGGPSEATSVSIKVDDNDFDSFFEELQASCEERQLDDRIPVQYGEPTNSTLNGNAATTLQVVSCDGRGESTTLWFLKHNNLSYIISTGSDKEFTDLHRIVSSFQFTE